MRARESVADARDTHDHLLPLAASHTAGEFLRRS